MHLKLLLSLALIGAVLNLAAVQAARDVYTNQEDVNVHMRSGYPRDSSSSSLGEKVMSAAGKVMSAVLGSKDKDVYDERMPVAANEASQRMQQGKQQLEEAASQVRRAQHKYSQEDLDAMERSRFAQDNPAYASEYYYRQRPDLGRFDMDRDSFRDRDNYGDSYRDTYDSNRDRDRRDRDRDYRDRDYDRDRDRDRYSDSDRNRDRDRDRDRDHRDRDRSYTEQAADTAKRVKDYAQDAYDRNIRGSGRSTYDQAADTMRNARDQAADKMRNMRDQASDTLQSASDTVSDVGRSAADRVRDMASSVRDSAAQTASNIAQAGMDTGRAAMGRMRDAAGSATQVASNLAQAGAERMKDAAYSVKDSATNTAGNVARSASTGLRMAAARALDLFNSAITSSWSTVKSGVEGLRDRISSGIPGSHEWTIDEQKEANLELKVAISLMDKARRIMDEISAECRTTECRHQPDKAARAREAEQLYQQGIYRVERLLRRPMPDDVVSSLRRGIYEAREALYEAQELIDNITAHAGYGYNDPKFTLHTARPLTDEMYLHGHRSREEL